MSCQRNRGNGEGRIGWNPPVEEKVHSERRPTLASPAHRVGSFHKEAGCPDTPTAMVSIKM